MRNVIYGIIIVAILGAAYYGIVPRLEKVRHESSDGQVQELVADAYPLYAGVSWGTEHAAENGDLVGWEVTAPAATDTDNIASATQPFETYYQEKLIAAGWRVDNTRAAGGPGASVTAYEKDGQYLVISFQTDFKGTVPDAPVQCPCDVTLSLFSGVVRGSGETTSAMELNGSDTAPDVSGAVGSTGVATHGTIDLTKLPLGDGKISTSAKVGYVYSCETNFDGGGAEHIGDWVHGDIWNLNEKVAVEGSVSWSHAFFSNLIEGVKRLITGNGLPTNSTTGVFPIQRSDPAYQYDRNPNSIEERNVNYSLPAMPSLAAAPSCVSMGAIGIAINGVAIYNALDADGRDAVAHETQDSCDGHPQGAGEYHYHGPSPCMPNVNEKNTVVGYALDGFPITSLYDANGNYYTNADLDACHGMTSAYTDENGKVQNGYHYVLTWEYPYTIGCYMGTPVKSMPGGGQQGGSTGSPQAGSGQSGPPQAAIDACSGKANGASCTIGQNSGTCRTTPDGVFACIP